MKTRSQNVSLPVELQQFIRERVRSGRYGNASDVVRAGLRALEREERSDELREFDALFAGQESREPTASEVRRLVRQQKAIRAEGRR